MASFPSYCKTVGTVEEENGDLDQSLQQMLKAIADERNRLNIRQEISGLGEFLALIRSCAFQHRSVLNLFCSSSSWYNKGSFTFWTGSHKSRALGTTNSVGSRLSALADHCRQS